MKLAEALMLRADYQAKLHDIQQRLINNVKVQEGETASEEPTQLLHILSSTLTELEKLIVRINKTNATVMMDETHTLNDIIAQRDTLKRKLNIYSTVLNNAAIKQDRYMRTEIKYISTINIADTQKEIDALSKALREINVRLQEKNWSTELL